MRLPNQRALNGKSSPRLARRRQEGLATIVVVVLISIVLIYVMGNARTLDYLRREVRLIESKQVSRWNAAGPATNNPAVSPTPAAAAAQP